MSPRISANDFINIFLNDPDQMVVIDLRGVLEYSRIQVPNSLNIPFTSIEFGDKRLETLNVPNLEEKLNDRIVVCISLIQENVVLVIDSIDILHKISNIKNKCF